MERPAPFQRDINSYIALSGARNDQRTKRIRIRGGVGEAIRAPRHKSVSSRVISCRYCIYMRFASMYTTSFRRQRERKARFVVTFLRKLKGAGLPKKRGKTSKELASFLCPSGNFLYSLISSPTTVCIFCAQTVGADKFNV